MLLNCIKGIMAASIKCDLKYSLFITTDRVSRTSYIEISKYKLVSVGHLD